MASRKGTKISVELSPKALAAIEKMRGNLTREDFLEVALVMLASKAVGSPPDWTSKPTKDKSS